MKKIRFETLPTERAYPGSANLDRLSAFQIVSLMNREDRRVVRAVSAQRQTIARAVDLIARQLARGGRLIFVGAGTSGRLGVIEAAECPPTFGTPPGQVRALMAGGRSAVFRSKEGAEDSVSMAERDIRDAAGTGDVVVGVAASGVTPYVRAALTVSRRRGAKTILVTCNAASARGSAIDVVVGLATGPEILAGSTRLKAGTACKMVLNMLTTASMVQLGKIYGNRMVDLQPKSRKLVARGQRLIEVLGRVSPTRARRLFKESRGHVKDAIVMARTGLSWKDARRELGAAGRPLRAVIGVP
ncbi:MAG TPA: N-acetylmuramic acid 6-phosphate etherase [Elusimicrobiota bacterium]|nr:N-acetylmuramic acid 6-phosphate etherase [Elusimicrobiota bacterium]